ncbi:MAG: rhodanese-like domain-containing protein [Bdellovibrionota bacterium]
MKGSCSDEIQVGETIEASAAYEFLKNNEGCRVIDVREPSEFRGSHIEGALNIPLSKIECGESSLPSEGTLFICCQRGSRAEKACALSRSQSTTARLSVIKGGMNSWIQGGLPVEEDLSAPIALERQVQIVAGSFVVIGTVLGLLVHPGFFAISGFVGCGLIFAGITNTCGLALVLRKLPYNCK